MPFGIRKGPEEHDQFGETIADVANNLHRDKSWDPHTVHSPHKDFILDLPVKLYPESTPHGVAQPLAVDMDPSDIDTDVYVDDLITISYIDYVLHALMAVPLAIYLLFRPVDPIDPVPRDDPLCKRKCQAEGMAEERKTILGWIVDTRLFRIFLTKHKFIRWTKDLDTILKDGKTTPKQLEKIIGRFNHVAHIIPLGRFFLNRLRSRLSLCQRQKFKFAIFSPSELDDLRLWRKFLTKATFKG